MSERFMAPIVCISFALMAAPGLASPSFDTVADRRQFEDQVRPLLIRHCVACHGADSPKGNLRLDQLPSEMSSQNDRERWDQVVERLQKGEMPPPDQPRPADPDIQTLTGWLAPRIAAAERSDRATRGRVIIRRLNRTEYENTVCDLLGIKINLKEQLPQDGTANGFDNAAAAHHTSSFLMEKYLEAADLALSMAIANRPKAPVSTTRRYSLKDGHPVRGTTENVYRFLDDGEVVCFCSSEWHTVGATQFYPQESGVYRFRISASSVQSHGSPITFRTTVSGTRLTGRTGLVGYFDAPADKPQVFEIVRFMEPRTTIMVLPYGLAGASAVHKTGAENWMGPGLAIQFIDVEGPLNEAWPPESHRRIFGELPQKPFPIYNFSDRVEVVSDQPLADAERILNAFARRAFRRSVTAADIEPFFAVVQSRMAGGATFEQSVRAALKGMLISPEFLFLKELPGKLDDFALASRLSYFLWSTMPDEELMSLAEKQELHQPDVLRQQVERMLGHPQAAGLTESFVGQWLNLREIDATEPSHIVYPEFDHLLKVSMLRETELFFEELIRNDRSLTNFVSSDFTMLNGRLAKHYGIPGVVGWEFKKTPLPADSHRGGVITMASVMKVTANGTTTSPVVRGAWVLDRILGTPPSPPPDGVTAIDPDIRGTTTIRDQLAKHRADAACASCHARIDPPGFALESFDCIGGWREFYRATGNGKEVVIEGKRMPYLQGKKVDPSNVTEDGQAFQNIDDFRQLLLRDKDQLARSLTRKMVTYATGAAPTRFDRESIDQIVSRIREKDYGLRSLIHEVVQSDLFQNK